MIQPIRLKQSIWNQIQKNFKVLDTFDFLDNDSDPCSFYEWAMKWRDYKFAHSDRLVIIDPDPDYYNEDSFGNNLYNFFVCCRQFRIPTEFIIFVSGTFNRSPEIKRLCDYFNLTQPAVCEHLYLSNHTPQQKEVRAVNFNQDRINRLFFSLNGTSRSYREIFLCHVARLGLLDQGYFGFYFKNSIKSTPLVKKNESTVTPSIPLRTTIPFTRINDFFEKSQSDLDAYNNYFDLFKNKNVSISDLGLEDCEDIWDLQPDFLQHGLINIVSETMFEYRYPYMSEKTIKPILLKRAFIHLSGPGILEILKNFGFKTYDTIWDESYDAITNASDRLLAVTTLMDNISKQFNHRTLADKIQEIAEYNYNHYIENNFRETGFVRWINHD